MSGAQILGRAGVDWLSGRLEQLWLRCPLAPIAASCILGVIVDCLVGDQGISSRRWASLWCGLGAAIAILWLARPSVDVWTARAFVVLMFLPLGAAAHRIADLQYQNASILAVIPSDPRPAVVEGIIDRPGALRRQTFAHRSAEHPWQTVVEIDLRRIRVGQTYRPCDGRLAITISGRCDGLSPGDSVRVHGRLRAMEAPSNPGAVDMRKVYRRRSLHGRMDVDSIDHVMVLYRHRAPLGRAIAWLADYGRDELLRSTDKTTGPLAVALVVGQRDLVDSSTRDLLLVTGTAHLLSVSGLHLAIVVMLARWAAIVMRLPMFPQWILVLTVCLLYTAITGARPPVLRAAVLVGAVLMATWIRRPSQPVNTLSLAAILLVLINPELVFSVGVHLSFLAVATLLLCLRRGNQRPAAIQQAIDRETQLADLIRGAQSPWRRSATFVGRKATELIWFSGCVTAMSLPLVWYHFHVISLISVISNVVLTPLLFLSLGSGIAVVAIGWLPGPLGTVCGIVCQLSLRTIQALIEFAASVPGGHFWLPSPPPWWVAVFYIVILGSMLCRSDSRASRFRYAWIATWLAVAIFLATWPASLDDATIEATFVDVGHGTSVVIRLSPDDVWLYDCGRLGNQDHSGRDIDSTLWSLGVTRLRGIILSHADADHFNSLPELLRRFSVEQIITPPGMLREDEVSLDPIRFAITRAGVRVTERSRGMSIRSANRSLHVLHPPAKRIVGSDNANSMVIRIDTGSRSLILPGDLEEPGVAPLVNQPRPPPGGVLMAPHHGSLTADAGAILHWARPSETVVSGGRRASRPEVLDMLVVTGSGVHITNASGAIRVRLDDRGNLAVRRWLDSPWRCR